MSEPHPCCGCHANGLKRYLTGVAITVTTAILLQSASLIWWAGTISTRVEYIEKNVNGLNARVHAIETSRTFGP